MDKTYNPHDIEQSHYALWEQQGYFSPKAMGAPYCIILPPPNITGSLHMGHGFQCTLMDIMIRHQRMLGKAVLWQPGTDHAGIATQMIVERLLLAENIKRQDLSREDFVARVWDWKKQAGARVTAQLRRLGASLAWERERFTMDPELSRAVSEVFISLYREGLIYKGQRLVNWDPSLLTAISDLEVVAKETAGELYYIKYSLASGEGSLIVATTRPETLFGDVAVAVHPDDQRYRHLLGQHLNLPLTDRTIPIIADTYVDTSFGSGCLKITPAHDFNDYQLGMTHKLALINIFTPQATLNHNVPQRYQGLDRYAARQQVIKDLTAAGLLVKVVPHTLMVPYGEKSGVVIEPYLTEQWFVKMNDLVSPAIEAVHSGLIRFIPEHWSKNYLQWLNNIADWCISRQLWWGHRIPVWYDAEGNHYAGHNEAEVRQHYQLSATLPLRQETDVLDTWFSSSLWPFAALGWPQDTVDFNRFFPSQVLVTGFDIIFFWVARMIMMSLKFTGQVPFAEVYITGLILDESGQKMSKTKGNVLDPLDLIDGIDLAALINKRTANLMQPDMASAISNNTRSQFPDGIKAYGSDALRLSFAAIASHAREINFDMSKLASCRNFCNKLWNAARFVLMHSSDDNTPVIISQQAMTDLMLTMPSNRWIISLLQQTIQHTNAALTAYRFDLLVNTLYEFTWNEFCDWYVEIAKIYLGTTTGTAINKRAVQYTLLFVLEILLRLLHPVIPFITAEIWQQVAQLLGKSSPNIMVAEYPEYCVSLIDNQAVAELSWVKEIVTAIRTIRSTINVSPKRLLTLIIKGGTPDGHGLVVRHEQLLKKLANLSEITCLNSSNTNQQQLNNSYVASAVVHDMELFIPLNQIVDYAVELAKLKKNISKLQQEYDQLSCKLADKSFTDNAPQAIVLKVQERLLKLSKNIHHQEAQVLQLTNSINC